MTHISPFYMDEGEKLKVKVRKHWFLVMQEFGGVFAMTISPIVVAAFIPNGFTYLFATPFPLFIFSAWMAIGVMGLATVWNNYYLDLWVVTDKRIVNIEQISLFNRDVMTMRLERVQDATVEVRGFWAEFFGFGNLTILSASHGNEGEKTFFGIPDPEGIKAIILSHVDDVTEHKSRLTFSPEKNPSSSL